MIIGGFSIEDWVALAGLIATVAGGILTMFRYIVLKPLNDSIKELGHKISHLGEKAERDAKENANDIENLNGRVTDHGNRLTKLETWKEAHETYVKSH